MTSWLVYDAKASFPTPKTIDSFEPFDDFTLVPYDKQKLFDKVDYSFNLDVIMNDLGNGGNYAFFNNITYVRPVHSPC